MLVPMALRRHDAATSLRSPDRFSDAMRVLSRRAAGDRRDVLVPRRSSSSMVVSETKSARPVPSPALQVDLLVHDDLAREKIVPTAAERRRRTLQILVGTALLSLGVAMLGVTGGWLLQLFCDLLLTSFVVHLRRQAVLKAQRVRRRPVAVAAGSGSAADRPARPVRRAVRIAGIPDRMPARPAPLTVPLPAPAARYEDRMPVPAAAGTWSPVPVPLPTYVGKAVAPQRRPRVVDLTRPGQWTAALEGPDDGLELLNDGPELEEILERRRVVNGW